MDRGRPRVLIKRGILQIRFNEATVMDRGRRHIEGLRLSGDQEQASMRPRSWTVEGVASTTVVVDNAKLQ